MTPATLKFSPRCWRRPAIGRLIFWENSPTAVRLAEAARLLGLNFVLRDEVASVEVDLVSNRDAVLRAVSRGMLEREQYLHRHGELCIRSLTSAAEIRPLLSPFYAMHIARWAKKGIDSPFCDLRQRTFLERFMEIAADTGWIRLLWIEWNDAPLAAEFAFYYCQTHYSAPWCFAVEHANRSPGHVLFRQSVLSAVAAGLHKYDLGMGDQEYKFRLPANKIMCRTWGLYLFEWEDAAPACEAAYCAARWGRAVPSNFRQRLNAARLYVALHWLSDGSRWAPASNNNGFLDDLKSTAERLGLL